MKITLANDATEDLNVTSYSHDFNVNYVLTRTSGNHYYSSDRLVDTDKFSTEITVHGEKDYVLDMYENLVDLRDAGKQIVLSEFDENIFSDMVDHSVDILCGIKDVGKQVHTVLNVAELTLELVAVDRVVVSPQDIKPSLLCLQNDWRGSQDWAYQTKLPYNSDVSFVADRATLEAHFKGKYILTLAENTQLMRWFQFHRGRTFAVTSQEFGTTNMFGAKLGDDHTVVISDLRYKVTSPNQRQVTIDLLRVNTDTNPNVNVLTFFEGQWLPASELGVATWNGTSVNFVTLSGVNKTMRYSQAGASGNIASAYSSMIFHGGLGTPASESIRLAHLSATRYMQVTVGGSNIQLGVAGSSFNFPFAIQDEDVVESFINIVGADCTIRAVVKRLGVVVFSEEHEFVGGYWNSEEYLPWLWAISSDVTYTNYIIVYQD